MSWLSRLITKEARRRFRPDDRVRYFTEPPRGKGKGVVHAPKFQKGVVTEFDSATRRYRVRDHKTQEEVDVHPRNLAYDAPRSQPAPSITEPVETVPNAVEEVSEPMPF